MTIPHQDFSIYQGDTRILEYVTVDQDGAPYDLAAATQISFLARHELDEAEYLMKNLSSGVSKSNPSTDGIIYVAMIGVDTVDLPPGQYTVQIIVTTLTDEYTVASGTMLIKEKIVIPN